MIANAVSVFYTIFNPNHSDGKAGFSFQFDGEAYDVVVTPRVPDSHVLSEPHDCGECAHGDEDTPPLT